MSDYGFWNLAQRDPEHVALIDADGGTLRAGELLADANRLVHGLRGLGLQQGDCIATCLPNGAPMVAVYLAAAQAGGELRERRGGGTARSPHAGGRQRRSIGRDASPEPHCG